MSSQYKGLFPGDELGRWCTLAGGNSEVLHNINRDKHAGPDHSNASLSHRTGAYIKKLRKIAPADGVELYGFSSRIYMTLFIMAYLFAFAMVYVWEMLTEKLCDKFSYAASSQSFIAPHFDYWSDVWLFCSKTASDKVEKVNERALRFVIGKMSFPNKDKWTSWSLEIICRLPKKINFVLSGFSSNRFPKHQLGICKRSFISWRIRWESCKLKEQTVLCCLHNIL